jgi:WD40 repeat protein
MFRWLLSSVLFAAGGVALLVVLAPDSKRRPPGPGPSGGARPAVPVPVEVVPDGGAGQALVIRGAWVTAVERQEAPSERDGKLLCIATEVTPEEEAVLPPGKVFKQKFGRLAIEVMPGDRTPPSERFTLPGQGATPFRWFQEDQDQLTPGRVHLATVEMKLRKLEWGERAKKGQLLALVDPALTLDELASKVEKLGAGEADVRAAKKTVEEARRRLDAMRRQLAKVGDSVSKDEYFRAKLEVERYHEEWVSKQAQVKVAQRELHEAWTKLKMHEVRAAIDGVVQFVYKNAGDAVKNLEPVVQIQGPDLLRIEGLLEVQYAPDIRRRLERARRGHQRLVAAAQALQEARQRGDTGKVEEARRHKAAAEREMRQAEAALRVTVEASRPERPRAVLRGHMKEVTCVAVSKGRAPWIVSGSEDQTVRVWGAADQEAGQASAWRVHSRLPHGAAVRALACTPPTASANLLLTGTADGIGRLFDLDRLEDGGKQLEGWHNGAIACVAFSPDGKRCATGGEDRAICVHETATGKLLSRTAEAHKGPLTSLKFASATKLVSAADHDPRLLTWPVEAGGKLGAAVQIGRRSGDVRQLDVSPEQKDQDGKALPQYVLLDEGQELRVLTLDGQKIVGALRNAPGAVNFATMALFSPDGQMVWTDGAAPGRLQLWRAPQALVEGRSGGGSRQARAAELRQFVWSKAPASCGAFAPEGGFAVTGMRDHRVLVWGLPEKAEVGHELRAQLSYVEQSLSSGLNKVPVRADLVEPPPPWLIPGLNVTLVIPPQGERSAK